MMPPPVIHPRDAMLQLIDLLSVVADNAVPIAQSKRTLYNAYIQQGFNEIQALELIKNATGIPGGF